MTVDKAYGLLKQEGYICIVRCHGAKILPSTDVSVNFEVRVTNNFQLLASEAIVKGMKKDDFLNLCKEMVHQLQYDSE